MRRPRTLSGYIARMVGDWRLLVNASIYGVVDAQIGETWRSGTSTKFMARLPVLVTSLRQQ